jgi:lysyl-tRNA synthetase class 2
MGPAEAARMSPLRLERHRLVAKDSRDLPPATRDSGTWSLGLHRPPRPLRPAHRGSWLPSLAGWLVAAAGLTNIVSALGPELSGRLRLLASALPAELVLGAHALTLLAGVALLAVAVFLCRRRRRALQLAIGLLLVVGGLDLVKGLDVEEALLSWSMAGLLLWGRDAFVVRPDDRPSTVLRQIAMATGGALAVAVALVACLAWATPGVTPALAAREIAALLLLTGGPLPLHGAATAVPVLVGAVAVGALLRIASLVLRPPPAVEAPCPRHLQAAAVVRAHGHDTLSYFKLRGDLPRHFSDDGRAFAAYRVENGVMLLAGDPVGPADALPGLLLDICATAEAQGLRLGAVGASEAFATLARDAGLRRFYLGDEAIVDTATFTLVGRPIKKVRQAVSRVTGAGYTAAAVRLRDVDSATFATLEQISDRWRDGAAERGFSMAMDSLRNPSLSGTLAVIARDGEGVPRGFLHFVPSAGSHTLSLSCMRRDRDTPNGLTDFLVVRAIELAKAQGIGELSLNFAAFARMMHEPSTPLDHVLGRAARWANPYFQIESLYRFNAKFFPRWQPRYLLYEGPTSLPRTALAAMWAEGQLPRFSLPGRAPRDLLPV